MARRGTAATVGQALAGAVAAPLIIHAVIAVAPGATVVAFALPFMAAGVALALRRIPPAVGLATGAVLWIGLLYIVLSGLGT